MFELIKFIFLELLISSNCNSKPFNSLCVDTSLKCDENNKYLNFEQRLNKLNISSTHYDTLISTFSPIILSKNSNQSASSALSHNEALRYLSSLPAKDNQHSNEENVKRQIELVIFRKIEFFYINNNSTIF